MKDTKHIGIHESVMKELNEKAQMSTKKMDYMEKNEVAAGVREYIDEKFNDDLKYFDIMLEDDGNKIYVDAQTKDVECFDGWTADDILNTDTRSAIEDYELDPATWNTYKKDILDEQNKIEKVIIPKIARDWGFRVVSEALDIREDDIQITRDMRQRPTVIDMIENNLTHLDHDYDLKQNIPVKDYSPKNGNIVTHNFYDYDQLWWDNDGQYYKIYINMIDDEDAELAKYICKVFDLHCEKSERRAPSGYNVVYRIDVPNNIVEKDAIDYITEMEIPDNYFINKADVARGRDKAKKRIEKRKQRYGG